MAEYQQLYRMFDKQDRLLYVGISKSALERFTQHAAEKAWIGEVVRVEIQTIECSRAQIFERERQAIAQENPVYNVAAVPGMHHVVVAKLRAARDRKRAETGRCEGPRPFGELPGEAEALTALRALARKKPGCDPLTWAEIAAKANAAGIPTRSGRPWSRGAAWNVLRAAKERV